jgi:hypothetical protein
MTTLDDLPLFDAPDVPRPGAAPARKCSRHQWISRGLPGVETVDLGTGERFVGMRTECFRCGQPKDHAVSRRSRNNRKRGVTDELAVARLLGGRKVGELGLPWDVECPGWLRAQAKKTGRWPSVAEVIAWLDAIPSGPELRAVTLADAPGPGGKVRRLIVLDLFEFSAWYATQRETTR